MKKLMLLTAAALLALTAACAAVPGEDGGGLRLYFASQEDSGPALVPVEYSGPENPGVRQLMSALLAGPEETELSASVPGAVALRSYRLEEGVLYLDLSENYGGLTGMELTLADYAITLTMCQLDGVEAVCITASGQPLNYRSHQILSPEEALLLTDASAEEES